MLQRHAVVAISIHAPRVGSDTMLANSEFLVMLFQSTLPVWGATVVVQLSDFYLVISIHAPRVGSDINFLSI